MANNRKPSKLNQQIDDNLRRVYLDVINEPLPERFEQLLETLRKQDNDNPKKPAEDSS